MWHKVIIPLALSCVFLASCSEPESLAPPPIIYQCAALTLSATPTESGLRVELLNQSYDLLPTVAASGARYRDNDFAVEFWSKGNEATLTVDGEAYPLCIEEGTLPSVFSARGNEPFWLVNIAGTELTLREPGTEQTTEVQARLLLEEEPMLTWLIETQAGLNLKLLAQYCQDSMSGQSYPYTAYLERDGEHVMGCAGDPRQLLEGVTWQRAQIAAEKTPTIRFIPESNVVGFAGCNQYRGTYQLSGEGLKFNPLAATKMLCDASAMAIEDEWFRQLTKVQSFRLDAVGELELVLNDASVIQLQRQK
ncbi:MAG TPA: META domain-containing protein [Pseudidiomarina sp.]|nr:META domain-containing protein [Pseudidiomarina sp.]